VGGATAAEPQFSGKRPIRSSWVVLGIKKCTGQELKVECTVATQADVPTRPFIDIKPDEARERKAIELFDFAQTRGKNDLQGALLGETVHCENCTRVARVRKVSLKTTHLQPPRSALLGPLPPTKQPSRFDFAHTSAPTPLPAMQQYTAETNVTDKEHDGYARTANLMAKYDEFAIFRRFKRLNRQNLLYLQAQIIYQEEEIDRLVSRDAAHPDRGRYASDWWALSHGKGQGGKEQWNKVKALRGTLEKYSDRNPP